MTIEPKLLSGIELGRIETFPTPWDVPFLLAHIAAQAEQIAAKDAEIERLKAGIEAFRRLQEQASRSYEHERHIIRGELTPQPKDQSHG
jgi:hypothetical protein